MSQALFVRVLARPSRGPVVELIEPLTISPGETFTQALMGGTPHVTRIGENTQGVFSDVLSRKLPNGWGFGLPTRFFEPSVGRPSMLWESRLTLRFRYSLMLMWQTEWIPQ